MTPTELKEKIMSLIDEECGEISLSEYEEFLGDLIDDLRIRLEATEYDKE